MIFLLSNVENGEIIYLPDKGECTIGRKNCDILILDDKSISREHAKLKIKVNQVTLQDCNSRYLTYHKGVEIAPNVEIRLNHMDLIQFGCQNSKFHFESYAIVASSSALNIEKRNKLKEALDKCRGKYVDKWSDKCTHLVVEKLILTIKVLQALVDEKHIVSQDYFYDYAKSISEKGKIPDINEYNKPPVGEQMLRGFQNKFDTRRRTLFQHKVFVFLDPDSKKQIEELIKSCGGTSITWKDDLKSMFDNHSEEEHIFITTNNEETNPSFDVIIKNLAKQKKRLIPLKEIALALAYCSCEKNCNPKFNRMAEVFGANISKRPTLRMLAPETQSQDELPGPSGVKTERIIPASVDPDLMDLNLELYSGAASVAKRAGIEIKSPKAKRKKIEKESKEKSRKADSKQSSIKTFLSAQKNLNSTAESGTSTKLNEAAGIKAFQNLSTAGSKTYEETPYQSQKRKAPDSDDTSKPLKLNPFALIRTTTNKKQKTQCDGNPFEMMRSSKHNFQDIVESIKIETVSVGNEKNPFEDIMNISSCPRVKNEINEPVAIRQTKVDESTSKKNSSAVSFHFKNSVLQASWKSKNNSIKNNTNSTVKEEDPELAEISKIFRNCVTVNFMPRYERASTCRVSNTSTDSVENQKNFKRFKKVQPLHPQITIMARHKFIKHGPGTGVNAAELDFSLSESESEEKPQIIVNRQRSNKKIIF
ncbi:nibrin isoform X1 [Euwallacea fornicatus]|uniref:nibrin isoform X1 n=1 Tax=Euwallacea fornicatus TaxID=995702 RepID=UPI00338F53F5